MRCGTVCLSIWVMATLGAQAQITVGYWAMTGQYGQFHVVCPEDATETIRTAAETFQRLWPYCTGQKIDVSPLNEGRINVWLGRGAVDAGLLPASELDNLGEEGFLIRTLRPSRRDKREGAERNLVIAGATDQGTINGVFDFFTRFLGVRYAAPHVFYAPRLGRYLQDIDYRHIPAFAYREIGYHERLRPEDQEYRRAHGFPLGVRKGPFGSATFYELLPPERFFAAHPEYYSAIGGERVAPSGDWRDPAVRDREAPRLGQLCAAHPGTAEAVLAELIALIKTPADTADETLRARRAAVIPWPERRVATVSPMEWGGHCECGLCREINEREGTPMASLLTLVNRVAEGLDAAFPEQGWRVHVLAREAARRPPSSIEARENVIIQVTTEGCDFGRALDDPSSPENAAFVQDLEAWSFAAEHIYVWDFAANLAAPWQPFPNIHVFQPNLRLYDQFDVEGVYFEAPANPPNGISEFDWLRSYVLSRLLWDPDAPADDLVTEFLQHYYGPAAPPIAASLNVIAEKRAALGLRLDPRDAKPWLDCETVSAAAAHFEETLAAPLEPSALRKVMRAHVPILYAATVCGQVSAGSESQARLGALPIYDGPLNETWPESKAIPQLLETLKTHRETAENKNEQGVTVAP